METRVAEHLAFGHGDLVGAAFDDTRAPGQGATSDDGGAVTVDAGRVGVEAGQSVPPDGVEPVRQALALALGEYDSEGSDVAGERVEFGQSVRTSWSCTSSLRISGRRRIHPATARGEGGRAVTGRGEVRFSRR